MNSTILHVLTDTHGNSNHTSNNALLMHSRQAQIASGAGPPAIAPPVSGCGESGADGTGSIGDGGAGGIGGDANSASDGVCAEQLNPKILLLAVMLSTGKPSGTGPHKRLPSKTRARRAGILVSTSYSNAMSASIAIFLGKCGSSN